MYPQNCGQNKCNQEAVLNLKNWLYLRCSKTSLKFMRLYCLIFAFVNLLSTTVYGQETPRFAFTFSAGPSVSLRKIAEKITPSPRAQLAGNGLAGQIGLDARLWKAIGLTARVNYNQNETRKEPLEVQAGYYNLTNLDITAQKWSGFSLMAGPTLTKHWGVFGLQGRLLAGYVMVNSPQFTINGLLGNRAARIEADSKQGQDIAYGAGATVFINLSKKFGLVINSDATYTNVEFAEVVTRVTLNNGVTTPITTTESQNVGILNITGGLRFSF
jgi:hypothetical protein